MVTSTPPRDWAAVTPRLLREPSSYRDRRAVVFVSGDYVVRALSEEAAAEWHSLRASVFFGELTSRGAIVATEELPAATLATLPESGWAAMLRHERVPFISYPYEWSFEMLRAAALLQLELLDRALGENFVLLDATPFNIQWLGVRPVFIDIPSFVRRRTAEPWLAYRQFCRMFLFPLLLHSYKGLDGRILLRGNLEGIDAAAAARLFGIRDWLRRGVFADVVLQSKFEKSYQASASSTRSELAQIGFSPESIRANVRRLRKIVDGLKPPAGSIVWGEYATDNSYSPEDAAAKLRFVEEKLALRKPRLVWDLGSNTGAFSRIAARHAQYVLAVDSDSSVVDAMFLSLFKNERSGRILPLCIDLADPTPNMGWRGTERRDLLSRGKPDLVLALALVHHLAISRNVPFEEIMQWLASFGSSLIVEFVPRRDPMVEKLLLNRREELDDYTEEAFRNALSRHFRIESEFALTSGRILFMAAPLSDS